MAEDKSRLRVAEQALAACSGAVITSLITTPLDVAKVRMQNPATVVVDCEHATCNGAGTSSSSMMMRVARHEGISALWSGLQPALPFLVLAVGLVELITTVLYYRAKQSRDRWFFLRILATMLAVDAIVTHNPFCELDR